MQTDAVWLAMASSQMVWIWGQVASGYDRHGRGFLHGSYYFPPSILAGTADLCHAHSAQGNCRYGCGGTNDAQNKTGNQECKTFQTTFHNTVPPLFCYFKLPQSPSVTAPSEREPCRQMQGNASLPEGGGCTVGADRGSYFFLKMISLLNT